MDAKTLRSASSSNISLSGDDAPAAAAATTTESAPAAAAAPTNVTPTSVLEAIKEHKEWARAVVFESDGHVVAGTVKPLEGEVTCVALCV